MTIKGIKFEEFMELSDDLPDVEEYPWVYGRNGEPYQVLSKDVGGLTLAAQWVRTDSLTPKKFDIDDYIQEVLSLRNKTLN